MREVREAIEDGAKGRSFKGKFGNGERWTEGRAKEKRLVRFRRNGDKI